MSAPPIKQKKFRTPEALQEAVEAYFADCEDLKRPYTIEGLACALDVDRSTIANYAYAEGWEEYHGILASARRRILANLNELALIGSNNAAVTIFNLKNNYGYTDKIETETHVVADIDLKNRIVNSPLNDLPIEKIEAIEEAVKNIVAK